MDNILDEIKYIEKGDSENCLFLIHGFCSGPEDWIEQIDFFHKKFTVIAPTLRGHDGNNHNERPMSIEQLSIDCVNILKKREFKKVIIAGHSMGTRLAIDIANRVKNIFGLILVDGSRFSDQNTYFQILSSFENSINQYNYQSVLQKMFSSMFFSNDFDNHKYRIIKRAIDVPEKFSLPLRRNAIWYDSHYVDKNLGKINLPILVLQSTKIDSKTGRETIKKNEKISYIDFIILHNDKNTIELFEKTGHYITIEKPKMVNEIIQKWLNDLKIHFR